MADDFRGKVCQFKPSPGLREEILLRVLPVRARLFKSAMSVGSFLLAVTKYSLEGGFVLVGVQGI